MVRTPGRWRTVAQAASPRWNCDDTLSRPQRICRRGRPRSRRLRPDLIHELGRGSSTSMTRSRISSPVGSGRPLASSRGGNGVLFGSACGGRFRVLNVRMRAEFFQDGPALFTGKRVRQFHRDHTGPPSGLRFWKDFFHFRVCTDFASGCLQAFAHNGRRLSSRRLFDLDRNLHNPFFPSARSAVPQRNAVSTFSRPQP
jgi:hypothetical protein